MSLLKRSAVTLIFQLGGQAVTVLAGIALARSLGPAGKGVTAYAIVALALVTTFFNGQNQAIAYQFGRRRLGLPAVHRAMMTVFAWVVPVIIAVMLGIGFWVPSQIGLIPAAAALPFALYAQFSTQFFLVIGKQLTANIQTFASTVFYGLGVFVLMLYGRGGLTAALCIWVASIVFGASYSAYHLWPYFRGKKAYVRDQSSSSAALAETTQVHQEVVREHFLFSCRSGLSSFASFLNLRIDVFVVSFMLGAAELGVYTLAIATGEIMWKLAQAVVWSGMGRIASETPARSALLVAQMSRNLFTFQLIFAIIAYILAPTLITLVYGPAFAEAATTLRFLLPGLVLYTSDSVMGYFFSVQKGKPTLRLTVQCCSIVACAAITFLTIPRFSIIGAAIATSTTYVGVVAVMLYFFTKETGIRPLDMFVLQKDDFERYGALLKRFTKRSKLGG
jgi:O-antigen/teichoic acid export membrane protein